MKKGFIFAVTAAALIVMCTACSNKMSDPQSQSSISSQTPSNSTVTPNGSGSSGSSNTGSSQNSSNSVVTPNGSVTSGSSNTISSDNAKQIALEHAQVQESELSFINVRQEIDDGVSVYKVEFYRQNQEYDYTIRTSDGTIVSFDYEIDDRFNSANVAISQDSAISMALAKVPGATASNIRLQLEADDGRWIYEGKIIYNNVEYDFEIDATNGTFIKWEQDSVFD